MIRKSVKRFSDTIMLSQRTKRKAVNERTSSRAGAARPERMESEEPVHGLEGSRPHRARREGGNRSRPQAEGAGPHVRCRLHLGVDARTAHARSHSRRARPEGPADDEGPRAE